MSVRFLEAAGSSASIVGVFTIALGHPFTGFVFSLTASLTYAVYAYLTNQKFFCLSSFVYACADVVGLIHWWRTG